MRKQIVLIRHAKTESEASSDHARELTGRGRRQAEAIGALLSEYEARPTAVLVSSAVRAVQTWELAAQAMTERGAAPPAPEIVDALYTADVQDIVEHLSLLDGQVERAFVIGHNPTIADAVRDLHDGAPSAAWTALQSEGFRPGALALLEYDGSWSELGVGRAVLTEHRSPAV